MSDLAAVTFLALGLLGNLFAHWQFRTGRRADAGRLRANLQSQPLDLRLLFAALPGSIAMGSALMLWLLFAFVRNLHTALGLVAVFGFLLGLVASTIWAVKEFFSPSESRTPEWLKAR